MTDEGKYSRLQISLNEFANNLIQIESSRDRLLKENRDIIANCSKAIILLHGNKITQASEILKNTFTSLQSLKKLIISDLDRYIWPAEQEYVEAVILLEIIEKKEILSNNTDLNISHNAYLTGLLDCIGEIKRMIYDKLRINDFETCISLFDIMQSIFDHAYPFAIYDNIVPGVRKKLDVSKRIIEDVRITITEEVRRKDFLTRLENKIQQ